MIKYNILYENMQFIDEYITEKVQWKRNMNSLLRKYNYNANDGTIKYNGNTYKINITRDKATSNEVDYNVSKNHLNKTGRFDTDSVVNLNPNDFKTMSLDDMETTLLHEIGHIRVNQDYKTLDPKTTKSIISAHNKFPKNVTDEYNRYANFNDLNDDEGLLRVQKMIYRKNNGTASKKDLEILKREGLDNIKLNDAGKGTIERDKFARNTENLANQRSSKQNYHANQMEYEADRYAADHLDHGNNRVQKYLSNAYKPLNKQSNQASTDYVINNRKDLDKVAALKVYTDDLDTVKRSNWKTVTVDGANYDRDDAIKVINKKIHDLKTNKETMKQQKYLRDSLKDSNSDISKHIKSINDADIEGNKNDEKSRKQALVASKYSDTKAFTTIDDKGTEHDKENRATTTKNKSSQGNMMAKQKK